MLKAMKKASRLRLPSQIATRDTCGAHALGSEHMAPSHEIALPLREAMSLSDARKLVGVGVNPGLWLQGGTQVPHCWHPLTFPWESSLVPPGFPQTTLIAHKQVAGLYLQENQWGPEDEPTAPCPRGHRTAHRNEMVTAHGRYTTWLSPKPLPQWRKETSSLWPGGHSQSPWTRGDTCPRAPPKRGWRTLCGRGGEQLSCACPQEAQGE